MSSKKLHGKSRNKPDSGELPKDMFNKTYYLSNKQEGDRIALRLYYKLATKYIKEGRVLDYGCGTGHLIKRFHEGYEAWAYDLASYARESAHSIAPYVHICSDIQALKFNYFDLVLSVHVLEHLQNPKETIRLFHTLLKAQGVLLFIVPNTSGLGHTIKKKEWVGYGDPTHISLMPAKQWLEWVKSAGFQIMECGTDGLWNVPYVTHVPLWLQKLIFYPMPAIQVVTGRLIWHYNWGESLIVIAQKSV
jgi:2-polyprenyl-3-methyl-5-hydroxy-6-metoxy-1,4-benzoquinol methylase